MEKIVKQPTELAQWYALVNEAQQASTIQLTEDTESYLVFLLMRYQAQPDRVGAVVADELLRGLSVQGEEAKQVLRDVGDHCLLISGLFPGRVKRRMVKVSYYVDLGQTAYSTLSIQDEAEISKLFAELCQNFTNLMDVLQATRAIAQEEFNLDLPENTLPIYNEIPDSLKGES